MLAKNPGFRRTTRKRHTPNPTEFPLLVFSSTLLASRFRLWLVSLQPFARNRSQAAAGH
jgi:hypothetical protein